MSKKEFLKTRYGSPVLPLWYVRGGDDKIMKSFVWVLVHPKDDKARQFRTHIQVNDIESGSEKVEKFFEEHPPESS